MLFHVKQWSRWRPLKRSLGPPERKRPALRRLDKAPGRSPLRWMRSAALVGATQITADVRCGCAPDGFSITAFFDAAAALAGRTTTATLNAAGALPRTLTASLEALARATVQQTTTFDATAQKRLTVAATLEARAVLFKTITANLDALARQAQTITATFDAAARATQTTTATLDAAAQRSFAIQAQIDAVAARVGLETVALDALAQRQLFITAVFDALVRRAQCTWRARRASAWTDLERRRSGPWPCDRPASARRRQCPQSAARHPSAPSKPPNRSLRRRPCPQRC